MIEEKDFVPCDDCVDPSACLTWCKIQEYLSEDIAKIRGEDE